MSTTNSSTSPDREELEARRSVFIYDGNVKRFVEKSSESVTFRDLTKILDLFSTSTSATQTSEAMPSIQTQASAFSNSVTFLELPFLEKISGGFIAEVARQNVYPSLYDPRHPPTTTTGRLVSQDDSILLETPKDSVPYIQFSVKKIHARGLQGRWLAVLSYDKESGLGAHGFETFKQRIKMHRYTDDTHPNIAKAPIYACTHVAHALVRLYIQTVGGQLKAFMTAIQGVEDSLELERRPSKLLRQLNTIGREVRAASLNEKFVFSMDVAKWGDTVLEPTIYAASKRDLLLLARGMEQYDPRNLRVVIGEVHQIIEDTIAERQQKRQEQLELREWELLEQNLNIARATQRDSRLMSGVAWVTMAFLPATFVSSFFGMNFFNGIAGNVPFDEASRSVWLFFAIAIPTSAFVLLTFHFWNVQHKKKDNHALELPELL